MSRFVLLSAFFLALHPFAAHAQTSVCQNKCGLYVATGTVAQPCKSYFTANGCRARTGCYCDDACLTYGDCCVGAVETCMGPQLSNVSPSRIPTAGGIAITLSGTHLGTTPGSVALGGARCPVSSWGDSRVIAVSPPNQGTNIPVSVTTGAGKVSNALSVSSASPSIQAVSPSTEVAPNTTVTLTGTNLGTTGGAVLVGTTSAVIKSQSHAQVTFVMPAGVGLTTVQYSLAGQVSNTLPIAYPKPVLYSFSPTRASTSGGVLVTIVGQYLAGANPTLTVGSQKASLTSVAPTTAAFTLPAGVGTVPVVLSAGGLQSAALSYPFGAPSLAALSPTTLKSTGGSLQILGQNFGPAGTPITITIGGQPCTLASATHTSLTCTAGPLSVGAQTVSVKVAGQEAGSLTLQVAGQ